ncbi:hypothetical protein Q2941_32505 [Bradyrhizobium sp. UFLA05-153]
MLRRPPHPPRPSPGDADAERRRNADRQHKYRQDRRDGIMTVLVRTTKSMRRKLARTEWLDEHELRDRKAVACAIELLLADDENKP